MEIQQLIVLGLLFADGVHGADLETFCTPNIDGTQSTAFATVDGNTVNGTGCVTGTLNRIQFQFVDKASNNIVGIESASYDPASGTCNTAWSGNVRCVNKTASNKYTYEVKFVANKTAHSQQYLTVNTNCVPSGGPVSPYSVDYTRCDPIPVAGPTTTISTTTTTTDNACTSFTGVAVLAFSCEDPQKLHYVCDSSYHEGPNCDELTGATIIIIVIVVCFPVGGGGTAGVVHAFVTEKTRILRPKQGQHPTTEAEINTTVQELSSTIADLAKETTAIVLLTPEKHIHVLIQCTNLIKLNKATQKILSTHPFFEQS